jgi:hypothetical protein
MTGIIIKIQASITSGVIDNLGEYEENATEKQNDTNIQDEKQTPPQNKP